MKESLYHFKDVVQAQFATQIGSVSSADHKLPDNIQWMPPGQHKVTAMKGDKPTELTVNVDAKLAETMQAILEDLLATAKAGQGDAPYLDFNHNDEEASAHAVRFFWGGDDPINGGVRLEVQWTEPGSSAVKGRAYRRFSPSFFVDDQGNVTGAPVNMGGLVNRAAFKSIQPLFTKQKPEGEDPSKTKQSMNDEEIKAIQAENKQLKAKVAKLEGDSTVKAKEAEIETLKTQNADLQKTISEQRKVQARALVDAAVQAGKLPSQNKELQTKWVDLIVADDKHKDLLENLPAQASAGRVIPNGNGGAAVHGAVGEHEFITKAKGVAKELGVDLTEAHSIVAKQNPSLYEDYRENFVPAK